MTSRRQSWLALVAILWLLTGVASCRAPQVSPQPHKQSTAPETRLRFVDIAPRAGLAFAIRHDHTPLNILETIGHGGALMDYNNDGWLDIVLVGPSKIAVFRNNRDETFTEVTVQVLEQPRRSAMWMGCAVADYDNDGWPDLFISGYRCFALYHNVGGRLVDVSNLLPLPSDQWATSAAFFDYDRDGWLDLYVGCYLQFGPKDLQLCEYSGVMAACHPTHYEPQHGHLFRNLGGAHGFVDVTRAAGLLDGHGKTLGVAAADYDGDGLCDLYLANDAVPSDLFRNLGGRFVNVGLESGTSLGSQGREQGAMGVDWGDYDNDGKLDLIVTNFQYEPRSLYRNLGDGRFLEWGGPTGLAEATINTLGFGVKFFDADNDGDLDLLMANGHVQDNVQKWMPAVRYAQPVQLFENQGSRFVEVTRSAGSALASPMVGRAVAVGDVDNDGALDALITNLEGAPRLLRNQSAKRGNYLQLRLVGNARANRTGSPRDGTGARVTIRIGNAVQIRVAGTGGSYLCASAPRVHFGLGSAKFVDELTIRWPSGVKQTLRKIDANQTIEIAELVR